MKKVIYTLLILLAMASASLAKTVSIDKVPARILENLTKDYPEAVNVRWTTEDERDYKASFYVGSHFVVVFYESDGTFVEENISMEWHNIPLKGRMHTSHARRILCINKVSTAENKCYFEITMLVGVKKEVILLDMQGNPIL